MKKLMLFTFGLFVTHYIVAMEGDKFFELTTHDSSKNDFYSVTCGAPIVNHWTSWDGVTPEEQAVIRRVEQVWKEQQACKAQAIVKKLTKDTKK